MATVTSIFSGNLTDAANVASAAAPATKPSLYILNPGPGTVKITVQVYATAANAVVSETSPSIQAGVSSQWTPKVFEEPFHEVIVTTTAVGVCTGIEVDLCEV